jgi:hypothetical protein
MEMTPVTRPDRDKRQEPAKSKPDQPQPRESFNREAVGRALASPARIRPSTILRLQASAGNLAVAQLLAGSAVSKPPVLQRATETEARESEVDSAIDQMYMVLEPITEVGASVNFSFWTSNGAITLVSSKRTERGSGKGAPTNKEQFADRLRRWLVVAVGTVSRTLSFDMKRSQDRWESLAFKGGEQGGAAPEEGRSVPLSRRGYQAETYAKAVEFAGKMVPFLTVPTGGSAEFIADVDYFDDKIEAWRFGSYQATPGHALKPSESEVKGMLINVMLAFTSGIGPRSVRIHLLGTQLQPGDVPVWGVAEAGVPHPEGPVEEEPDPVKEYRRMHEEIFIKARAEMKEVGIMVAGWTVEQVALWIIGGAIFKIFGAAFEAVAPELLALLRSPESKAAMYRVGELVSELAPEEEAALKKLAAKAEAEGMAALGPAEKAQLEGIFTKLNGLLRTSGAERQALMAEAAKVGAKFTESKMLWIVRSASGDVCWLEEGNAKAGLQHILENEATSARFAKAGVPADEIPRLLKKTLEKETPIRIEGDRRIYAVTMGQAKRELQIIVSSTGSKGFVVSAYPGAAVL